MVLETFNSILRVLVFVGSLACKKSLASRLSLCCVRHKYNYHCYVMLVVLYGACFHNCMNEKIRLENMFVNMVVEDDPRMTH